MCVSTENAVEKDQANETGTTTDCMVLTDQQIESLLQQTSRTFALAIPFLPMPLRRYTGVAYLLFRIADTVEDGDLLNIDSKVALFDDFVKALRIVELHGRGYEPDLSRFDFAEPTSVVHDRDLFRQTRIVLQTVADFPDHIRRIILRHVRSSSKGMQSFLIRSAHSGQLQISTIQELRSYCFCVAGLVGEMLTQLFLQEQPELHPASGRLMDRAAVFGEALQLVNILKDSRRDESEGRRFIPQQASRRHLLEQARFDLQKANEYIELLQLHQGHSSIIRFVQLPVQLAWLTLIAIEERGEGGKVTREEVMQVLAQLHGG